jgi:hypothetical protein
MKLKILILLVLCASLQAQTMDSVGQMMSEARQLIGVESTTLLPDTTLRGCVLRSLVWTSTDIGGVESQYRFVTVALQAFYAIPDSTTEVLGATVRTEGGQTRSLKAWYPQFFEDLDIGDPDEWTASSDNIPFAYHYWDDTLQLLPHAVRDNDTIILFTYVEHKTLTNESDTDSMAISFSGSGYTQAALYYACAEAAMSIGRGQLSQTFMAGYEKKKAELFRVYNRRFDARRE